MKLLTTHLQKLRMKPALYLGELSLEKLATYIHGFYAGIDELTDYLSEERIEFYKFHEYVKDYYGFTSSVPGWCILILKKSANEEEAFANFFYLFDQFCKEVG